MRRSESGVECKPTRESGWGGLEPCTIGKADSLHGCQAGWNRGYTPSLTVKTVGRGFCFVSDVG